MLKQSALVIYLLQVLSVMDTCRSITYCIQVLGLNGPLHNSNLPP